MDIDDDTATPPLAPVPLPVETTGDQSTPGRAKRRREDEVSLPTAMDTDGSQTAFTMGTSTPAPRSRRGTDGKRRARPRRTTAPLANLRTTGSSDAPAQDTVEPTAVAEPDPVATPLAGQTTEVAGTAIGVNAQLRLVRPPRGDQPPARSEPITAPPAPVVHSVKLSGRPPHSFGTSMGDHTSAYVVQVRAVQNAVRDRPLDRLPAALAALQGQLEALEGWRLAPTDPDSLFGRARARHEAAQRALVAAGTEPDPVAVAAQNWIATFLELREVVPLSTIHTRAVSGAGGKGRGESKHAQALDTAGPQTPAEALEAAVLGLFDVDAVAIACTTTRDTAQKAAPGAVYDDSPLIMADAFLRQHLQSLTMAYPEAMTRWAAPAQGKTDGVGPAPTWSASDPAFQAVRARFTSGQFTKVATDRMVWMWKGPAQRYLKELEGMVGKPEVERAAGRLVAAAAKREVEGVVARLKAIGEDAVREAGLPPLPAEPALPTHERSKRGTARHLDPLKRRLAEIDRQESQQRTDRDRGGSDEARRAKREAKQKETDARAAKRKRVAEDGAFQEDQDALDETEENEVFDDETAATTPATGATTPVARVADVGGSLAVQVVLRTSGEVDRLRIQGRTVSPFSGTMGAHTTSWVAHLDRVEAAVRGMTLGQACSIVLDQLHREWQDEMTKLGTLFRLTTTRESPELDRYEGLPDAIRLQHLVADHLARMNLVPGATLPVAGTGGNREGDWRKKALAIERGALVDAAGAWQVIAGLVDVRGLEELPRRPGDHDLSVSDVDAARTALLERHLATVSRAYPRTFGLAEPGRMSKVARLSSTLKARSQRHD